MKVLIAEDDSVSRRMLEALLKKWGFETVACADGLTAVQSLQGAAAPSLAILDWLMPGMDGIEICRQLRAVPRSAPLYLLLVTSKTEKGDLVAGLQAGADDYVAKPFDHDELRARLQVGVRMVNLQRALADRVRDLEQALSKVKQLQGLLPICSYCKKVRDDKNYWQQVETYVSEHSQARFSHGICPSCYQEHVRPQLESMEAHG